MHKHGFYGGQPLRRAASKAAAVALAIRATFA